MRTKGLAITIILSGVLTTNMFCTSTGVPRGWSGESQDSPRPIWDVAFLPDGKRLVSAAEHGVILWDVDTGQIIRLMEKSQGSNKLAISADGEVVIATVPGGLGLWKVETGKRVRLLASEQNWVKSLAMSHDKKLALVGGNGPLLVMSPPPLFPDNLQLWKVEQDKVVHRLFGHNTVVYSVAISPDARLGLSAGPHIDDFTTGAGKSTIILWDLPTGAVLRRYELPLERHQVRFSKDGKAMYALGKTCRQWDIETGQLIRAVDLGERQSPFAFSRDLQYYLTQQRLQDPNPDGTITVWKMQSGKTVRELHIRAPARAICGADFSPSERLIALAAQLQLLQVWDLDTGKLKQDFKVPVNISHPLLIRNKTPNQIRTDSK